MNTAERLQGYQLFGGDTIESISEVAELQASLSYLKFFKETGLKETKSFRVPGYSPIDVVDILPESANNEEAIVLHLPMANPLDPNQLYKVATIAALNRGSRVIASANPSRPGYRSGLLTRAQRIQVAKGDFRPTVEPLVRYLENQHVSSVRQAGYSYGADKAMAMAAFEAFDVSRTVAVEPASVVRRSGIALGAAFASTKKALEGYVALNEVPAFVSARSKSVNRSYPLGLTRLTNLAIARGLTDGKFAQRTSKALKTHEGMIATFAWGSESELALDGAMRCITRDIGMAYGQDRIRTLRAKGAKHALADDIHLHAALITEGLR